MVSLLNNTLSYIWKLLREISGLPFRTHFLCFPLSTLASTESILTCFYWIECGKNGTQWCQKWHLITSAGKQGSNWRSQISCPHQFLQLLFLFCFLLYCGCRALDGGGASSPLVSRLQWRLHSAHQWPCWTVVIALMPSLSTLSSIFLAVLALGKALSLRQCSID